MGCPRCSSSLTTYTLDEQESTVCEACGWVGIETTLQDDASAGQTESWAETMARGPNYQVPTDRRGGGLPPVVTGQSWDDAEQRDQEANSQRQASGTTDNSQLLEQMDGLDSDIVEQLAAAGIETIGELASADTDVLARQTTLAESTLDSYSRKAAIQIVTTPEANPTAFTDSTED